MLAYKAGYALETTSKIEKKHESADSRFCFAQRELAKQRSCAWDLYKEKKSSLKAETSVCRHTRMAMLCLQSNPVRSDYQNIPEGIKQGGKL